MFVWLAAKLFPVTKLEPMTRFPSGPPPETACARSVHSEADRDWLRMLITRTVPFDRWQDALEKGDDDIKVVVEFAQR